VRVIKPLPDMCRCSDALLVAANGIVTRVQSCPVCVGRALEWFGHQYDLFVRGDSVSVRASDQYDQLCNTQEKEPFQELDGLPF